MSPMLGYCSASLVQLSLTQLFGTAFISIQLSLNGEEIIPGCSTRERKLLMFKWFEQLCVCYQLTTCPAEQ